jgi:beta-lactamase superfamily II metal-dependent hydrolase
VITATRDRRYFVYDAGGIDQACLKAIRGFVSAGHIDLLVISHTDGDHMQDVPKLLGEFTVGEIWWTGYRRPQLSYRKTVRAIAEAETAGTLVRDLRNGTMAPGTAFRLGDATVTFVAGWRSWPDPDGLDEAELHKVVSIVVRLDYADASLLLTGDTIGRLAAWPDDECGFAEADMVGNQAAVALAADVLLAPNHGANNGSSRCLIDAVEPTYVIFPAGHGDSRPSQAAAARYLSAGIPASRLLRTDRGDDEGEGEWAYLRSADCRDQPGDDDIEVLMPDQGPPIVRYLRPNDVCVVIS